MNKPLTREETIQLRRMLGEDAWKLTPATMANKLSGGAWLPMPHLLYCAAKIATAIRTGNGRLLLSMPPRHGKSELLSVWTSIWALDLMPELEIILASYGADLSQGFSRKVRDIIIECQDGEGLGRLDVEIRKDVRASDRFKTTVGGGMRAVGVNGSITGHGAGLLMIDDYIKGAKEAASHQIKQDIKDWFGSVAMTRLAPNATVIVLATRWNIDDLHAHIETLSDDKWESIVLPGNAHEGDPLGREIGEALWPGRFSEVYLAELKDTMGPYFFAALYDQKPKPRSGSGVTPEHFQIVDIAPAHLECVRSWDMAGTEDAGDYTVGLLQGFDKQSGYTYILNVERFRKGPYETECKVKEVAETDGPGVRIFMEQEPGSAGKTVISHYSRKVMQGFAFKGERSTGDKFIRAQPYYAQAAAMNVKLLRGPWNKDYIDEVVLFPDSEHDDQVDASSGGYNYIHGKNKRGVTWGRGQKLDGARRGTDTNKGIVTGATFGRQRTTS